METCRSIARSPTENCVFVSEWRRKNGKIDPKHSCPMNVQVDLPKESAFVTDSALILTEKLLATMVSWYTKSLVNTNSFYTNFTNTHFQKVPIPYLTRTMKQKFLH